MSDRACCRHFAWPRACSAGPRLAHAQSAEALKKAQASFDQAQLDYLQGNFEKAGQEFQEAYDARNFSQFLYDAGGAFYMKAKKDSDEASYQKAVDYYKKYIEFDPGAADKAKVEKAIGVLQGEIQRIQDAKAAQVAQGSGAGSAVGTTAGSAVPPPVVAPSQAVTELGDAKVRGLIVIESEPQNASIYLDDRKNGVFATTPWSGSLEGEHKIIIEKRGYQISESTISADPSKLFVLRAVMSQQSNLGWVEVTSNIPNSDIYIDDKNQGAIGRTPMSQNIAPGKHTFWISAEGYDEYKQDVEVIAGETIQVKATLKGNPVGKLNVLGVDDRGERRSASTARCSASAARACATSNRAITTVLGQAARREAVHAAHQHPGEDRDLDPRDARARAEPRRRDHGVRARGRLRRRRHLPRRAGEPPARPDQERHHRRQPAAGFGRSAVLARQDLRDGRPTAASRVSGDLLAHRGLLHVPRQGRAVDRTDRRARARAAARGLADIHGARDGRSILMRTH